MAAETPITSAPATPNAAGDLAPAAAPTLPAVAAQPAQSNASPAKPAAPEAIKSESAKHAAPPQTSAPTHAAPTNPAPANSTQANAAAPQPAPPLVFAASQTLPAPMQQAPAAVTAPMPPSLVAAQPRALKTPALETKPAPEFAPVRAAPAKPAKPVAAGAIASEPAPTSSKTPTPAPTLDPAQSLPQQPQLSTTSLGSHASTHVQHTATDAGAHRAAPAAAQVAREIIRRFDGGATSFELRLDPPELGRVEVRMEVSRDHRVTAVIAADSPQALTELARHARELEAQLQSAGLQLSDSGLSFDLRQGARGDDAQESESAARRGGGETAEQQQTQTQTARPIGFERWRGVRVDMMV
jgi:flagellar hook-length control protein FliK